jgi:hypothetical protein
LVELAVDWAESEADRLASLATSSELSQVRAPLARHEAAAALEFLRRQGSNSQFYLIAAEAFGSGRLAPSAFKTTASVLRSWAAFVRTGLGPVATFAVRARVEAATDLMEQVQRLLEDRAMHAAAPVMLAGAALEELLRAEVEATGVAVKGKPGLNSYAQALQSHGSLTSQDVKDITAWAGQRNAAAHGQFDLLSRERAALMADGVNLFMRQREGARTS